MSLQFLKIPSPYCMCMSLLGMCICAQDMHTVCGGQKRASHPLRLALYGCREWNSDPLQEQGPLHWAVSAHKDLSIIFSHVCACMSLCRMCTYVGGCSRSPDM